MNKEPIQFEPVHKFWLSDWRRNFKDGMLLGFLIGWALGCIFMAAVAVKATDYIFSPR